MSAFIRSSGPFTACTGDVDCARSRLPWMVNAAATAHHASQPRIGHSFKESKESFERKQIVSVPARTSYARRATEGIFGRLYFQNAAGVVTQEELPARGAIFRVRRRGQSPVPIGQAGAGGGPGAPPAPPPGARGPPPPPP